MANIYWQDQDIVIRDMLPSDPRVIADNEKYGWPMETTLDPTVYRGEPGSDDYELHSEETIGAYFRRMVAIDPDHRFVAYPDRDLRRRC